MPVPPTNAVGLEILPIDGEDFARPESFRCNDQRGICKIHWMVRVQVHQLESTGEGRLLEPLDRHASLQHEFAQAIGSEASWPEHVKGFRQHRHGRVNRLVHGLERFDAALMLVILGVEQRDERSGVDEHHRRIFLRIA